MLKNKHSLRIISGTLSASGVGTTLASANLPQNEQKIGGVYNTSNLKELRYDPFLQVALLTVVGVGLLSLAVWAFIHKHVAIKDLDFILLKYMGLLEECVKEKSRVEEYEKKIIECKKNINGKLVFDKNGTLVKLGKISAKQLRKIYEEYTCYGRNTQKQIAQMEKTKSDFLNLLEKNKDSLKLMGEIYKTPFDLDKIELDGKFEVTRILDIFENSNLYKENSDNFDIKTAVADLNTSKDCEKKALLIKEEDLEVARKSFKIWGDKILPAFIKAKKQEKSLKELLASPRAEEEKKIGAKTKDQLSDLHVLLLIREFSQYSNEIIEKNLKNMKKIIDKAKERRESLQNNFWDFGNNFFKLHGNEDLLTKSAIGK